MKKGYHKTKSGKTARKGLYYNINKRKKAGTSRSKKKSTIRVSELCRDCTKRLINIKKGSISILGLNHTFWFKTE